MPLGLFGVQSESRVPSPHQTSHAEAPPNPLLRLRRKGGSNRSTSHARKPKSGIPSPGKVVAAAADSVGRVRRQAISEMGNVLEGVDRQIRLAGHNRMAMLLFSLHAGSARCALNVFKVREVLRCPAITPLLGQNACVAGSLDYRGKTIPAIDLALALGLPALAGSAQAHLVVTEFSRSMQAFIVGAVDRIVHVDVASIEPPREGMVGPRINATTRVDGALVMIVDVEQILADVSGVTLTLSPTLHGAASQAGHGRRWLLIVDDSSVARRNMEEIGKRLGLRYTLAQDGVQALEILRGAVAEDGDGLPSLVISDIEMPRLDGYALTRAIREDPALARLRVVLHSSLSGGFNADTVASVGADRFVAKFNPDVLAKTILELLPASD